MTGPKPKGFWTHGREPGAWGVLLPGRRYRVAQEFLDYDHFLHAAGETWTYLSFGFLPYDDGLSLFVSLDGEQEWHIRMQLREEEQDAIMHDFGGYVEMEPEKPKRWGQSLGF